MFGHYGRYPSPIKPNMVSTAMGSSLLAPVGSPRTTGGLPASRPVTRRRWSTFGFTCRESFEVAVDCIGNGRVGEWERLGVSRKVVAASACPRRA